MIKYLPEKCFPPISIFVYDFSRVFPGREAFLTSVFITSRSFWSANNSINLTCLIDTTPKYISDVSGFVRSPPATSLAFVLPSYFTSTTKWTGINLKLFGTFSFESCMIKCEKISISQFKARRLRRYLHYQEIKFDRFYQLLKPPNNWMFSCKQIYVDFNSDT